MITDLSSLTPESIFNPGVICGGQFVGHLWVSLGVILGVVCGISGFIEFRRLFINKKIRKKFPANYFLLGLFFKMSPKW